MMMYRKKKEQMKKCLLIQKLKEKFQLEYQVLSGNILKKSLMIMVFIYIQNATTAIKNIKLKCSIITLNDHWKGKHSKIQPKGTGSIEMAFNNPQKLKGNG